MLSQIDKNFAVQSQLDLPDVQFFDVKCAPFSLHGIFHQDGMYRRMPEDIAAAVSFGVEHLAKNTAGGRVRFCTDSPYIAISAKMPQVYLMPHMALTGSASFDLYRDDVFVSPFARPDGNLGSYESVRNTNGDGLHTYTVNFPCYARVDELYIGIKKGSRLEAAPAYPVKIPVVFYGSSITQGACTCRPGCTYENILSRQFQFDYTNLGFSGSAKAEPEMIQYLSSLPMSVFVCDYDYNAPDADHLRRTHYPLYDAIRKSHPDIPIVMMARPKFYRSQEEKLRFSIIQETYERAKAAGDTKVYLFSGPELMAFAQGNGMTDEAHPNDVGFYSIAKALSPVFEKIL